MALGCFGQEAGAQSTKSLQHAIAGVIGNLGSASGVVYDAHTTDGLELDALKVIQGPQPGNYLGVFDTIGPHNLFVTRLAWSDHLGVWRSGPILSMHASMPTILYAAGGYLVAFETEVPNGDSQIEVEHFASLATLMVGHPDRATVLPRRLSAHNEGTPSIEAARLTHGLADSVIVIGFHYDTRRGVDRNGVGVLRGFSSWTERPNVELNGVLEADGVKGNIGDRDAVTIEGMAVQLVGGQSKRGNWSTWRLYAYSPALRNAVKVPISGPSGTNLSIGVARSSIVRDAAGTRTLVLTAFVYQQGSPPAARGELVWWRPAR